jgi:hypothetical protein
VGAGGGSHGPRGGSIGALPSDVGTMFGVPSALAVSVLATMAMAADRSRSGNREVGTRIGRQGR